MASGLADKVRGRAEVAVRGGGGEVAAPPRTLRQQIEDMSKEFARALPKGLEAQQLIRDALSLVRTTRSLDQCSPESVLGGLMTFAQLGLRPGVLGHGWLIPFKDWKTQQWHAQIVIGYKGMAELVHRSGQIETMVARPIHANDDFSMEYGLRDDLVHRPAMRGPRGPVIGYYAIIKYKGGGYVFWHMTRDEGIEWRNRFAMSAKTNKVTGEVTGSGPWFDMAGPDGGTGFDQMVMKGLALDTPLPTPSGWTTMGAVQPGDDLLDMHGQPCRVLVKSEVKHLDCYRVTFGNGESIVCDSEHLWLAHIGWNGARDGYREYEIGDLYAAKAAGKMVTMPVAEAADLPEADLPIDPWVLGYWLGDGASANPSVTCNVDNLDEITAAIRSAGYEIGSVRPDPRSRAVTVYVKGIKKRLADLGLIGHKHVPPAYLRGSARQRLALLRGLMDSDGSIDRRRKRARFSSTDPALADAVAELARSLGEMVNRGTLQNSGYGKIVTSHWVSWTPAGAFPVTLARKVALCGPRVNRNSRGVKSIERVETVPTQCIGVDSTTSTFLAGEDWAPTHNTCFLRAARWAPKGTDLAIARATEVDGAVRFDVDADDPDRMLEAQHPENVVVDGTVVDTPADTAAAAPAAEPAPAEPAGPAPSDPATQAQHKRIMAMLGKRIKSDAHRHALFTALCDRPITSQADVTAAEADAVYEILKGWGKAGELDAEVAALDPASQPQPAADTPAAAPAGDLPKAGTPEWHAAGHPTLADGHVTTVPDLLNGDCGFCDGPK